MLLYRTVRMDLLCCAPCDGGLRNSSITTAVLNCVSNMPAVLERVAVVYEWTLCWVGAVKSFAALGWVGLGWVGLCCAVLHVGLDWVGFPPPYPLPRSLSAVLFPPAFHSLSPPSLTPPLPIHLLIL